MRIGLIGVGYWGKIIKSKLIHPFEVLFLADSKFDYQPFMENVEWVIVASSTNSHFNIVKNLLNKGVNVFCEKPLTTNYTESKELIELANQNDVKLYVNNIFLKREVYQSLKTHIDENVSNLSFTWKKYGPFNGDLLNDLLYHDLYLFLDLTKLDSGNYDIVLNKSELTKDTYSFEGSINNYEVSFVYDRLYAKSKKKELIINDKFYCDFSSPDNDPLNESLHDVILDESIIDYNYCHKLSLQTQMLFEKIVEL